jgi:prevent-host-death family protein
MDMRKNTAARQTSASQLKAKMGQFMRAVRSGQEVIITDRNEPVARLVPIKSNQKQSIFESLHDSDAPPLGEIKIKGVKVAGLTSLEMLLEDRNKR